jgi:hypothetical protein
MRKAERRSWAPNARAHLNRHRGLGLSSPLGIVPYLGTAAGASLIGNEIRVVLDADSNGLWD